MERGWLPLVINVANALSFSPLLYPRSIIGDSSTWNSKSHRYTELQQFSPENFPKNLKSLYRILVPGWAGSSCHSPGQSHYLGLARYSRALPFPVTPEKQSLASEESWLFINGICTDESILYLNAKYLYELFGRPLTLLHNQTNGVWVDLLECGLGKGWGIITEAVRGLFPAFYSELKRPDKKRVVLIAHSQGTILAAVFLSLLRKLLGKKLQEPQSIEQHYADNLLSEDPQGWAINTRVMRPGAGPAGSKLLRYSDAGHRSLSIEAWLNWREDAILGLPPLTIEELKKLEIYNFATCATDFTYIANDGCALPYIEHFGNEMDAVARMGLFSPHSGPGVAQMDGQIFTASGAWGYLLNAHYLSALEKQWQGDQSNPFRPRFDDLARESRLKQDYIESKCSPATKPPSNSTKISVPASD